MMNGDHTYYQVLRHEDLSNYHVLKEDDLTGYQVLKDEGCHSRVSRPYTDGYFRY